MRTDSFGITRISKISAKILILTLFFSEPFFPLSLLADNQTPNSDGWMIAAYSGNDSPYRSARAGVEIDVKTSTDPLSVVKRYKLSAMLRPLDPLAVFSWATAVYEYDKDYATSDAEIDSTMKEAREALKAPPSPNTYNYTRLRYLFEISGSWQNPQLKSLGDRLLSHEMRDPEVLRQAGFSHGDNLSKAVSMLTESITLEPTDPAGYLLLGYTYLDTFNFGRGPREDGEKAIVWLRKYLAMHPKDHDTARLAEHYLAEATRELNNMPVPAPTR